MLRASLTALVLCAGTAAAAEMRVEDAASRIATPAAQAGALYMRIFNETGQDDRLLAARSDAAAETQLHVSAQDAGGVMRMTPVEDGLPVAAGEVLTLESGGAHVMLMGLERPLPETAAVTLIFERAGEVRLDVPLTVGMSDGHAGH
ncbi:copper chaperone PCu(A)C [Roseitranquillus sediminis]|uniref:copper chaperone PCu(A)C n=1 Tax=Roseitranquillus sediminis TaxID=2809051 RepID=UPI001D0CB37D|nr:copper chaperone PCu(A)C [Roseitranquillus sediminis]MBM9594348.1 copper chaperone PCu(A)C [Roseitranquillus sediminis]